MVRIEGEHGSQCRRSSVVVEEFFFVDGSDAFVQLRLLSWCRRDLDLALKTGNQIGIPTHLGVDPFEGT